MFSKWEKLHIPFVGGIDTKSDEKYVQATRLTSLENGVFEEHGSIKKRFGYQKYDTPVNPELLASFKDELVLAANSKLYSQDDSTWVEKADFQVWDIRGEDVCQIPEQQYSADQAESDVNRVYIWQTAGGVYYSVQDKLTGQWLVNNVLLAANGTIPRAISLNNRVTLLWADTGATNLDYFVINDNDPTSSEASGTLISDLHADGLFDVCDGGVIEYFVAYKSTLGSDNIRVSRIVGTVIDTTNDTGTTHDTTLIAVDFDGTNTLVVAYTEAAGNAIRTCEFNEPLADFLIDTDAAVIGGTEFRQLSAFHEGGSYYLVYNDSGDLKSFNSDFSGVSTLVFKGAGLASHVIEYNDQFFVVANYSTALTLQNAYYLVSVNTNSVPGAIVGQLALGSAVTLATAVTNHLPSFDINFRAALITRKRLILPTDTLQTTSQIVYSESGITGYQFLTDVADNALEVGDALYFPGGTLWLYDGVNLGEAGPLLYPEPDITIGGNTHTFVSVGAGGSIAAGDYGYKILYQRRTHYNEVVTSFAVPFSVNVASGSQEVTLTIPTLTMTNYDDWFIVVYRTVDGGTNYHRVSNINPETNTGDNRWIDNNRSVASVTFIDALADASITALELEPSTGGVLANLPIKTSAFLAKSKRRVFTAGGEIPVNRVYFSKLRGESTVVEFNDQLFIDVDESGGPVTALATLSDRLVIFKRDKIYLVNGDGPNNLGQGNFQEPLAVSTDSGCSNSEALVEMPLGIIFKSAKGIYLLQNNGVTQYIGAPVELFNDLTCVSADLLPDENAVVFLHSNGVALYYDYVFDQWSTFTGHQGISATVYKNQYTYLNSSQELFIQDNTNFKDGNRPYALKFKTGPIRVGGLQEFWRAKRVYLLGEYFTPHKLQVDVYLNRNKFSTQTEMFDPTDYIDSATWGGQATWGDDEVWGGSGADYQKSIRLQTQKVQSVSFEFTEIPDSLNNGRAFQLTELALEWAPLRGLGRLDVARRK